MPRRILICIEDTGVAHVVAARLMKDGADGVVVGSPADLVAEANDGAIALVVQDKYPSGEAGASLLRQVRMALGTPVPGVYLLTGELADADRSVLAKQYKVQEFLSVAASPHQIAGALLTAARPADDEPDIVLHEDEADNDFDIDLASKADMEALPDEPQELNLDDYPEASFDGDSDAMTVEVSVSALKGLGLHQDSDIATDLPTRRVHDEVTRGNPLMQQAVTHLGGTNASSLDASLENFDDMPRTQEGGSEPPPMTLDTGNLEAAETGLMEFTMPAPGASRDLELPVATEASQDQAASEDDAAVLALEGLSAADLDDSTSGEAPADDGDEAALLEAFDEAFDAGDGMPAPDDPPTPATVKGPEPLPPPDAPAEEVVAEDGASDEEDEMQVQQLKKALLAKKRELEAATKRIDELEDQLASADAGSSVPSDGVPSEGVFEDLRYPALLARARAEAWSGTIKMQLAGDVTRTIFIKKGLPVAFTTSEAGDKIGRVLVATGRITDEQYVKAATRMVERGIKLADALVDLGLLDKETLEVEVRNLTRDQIIAGFEQTQGRFTTTEGEEPNDSIPCFDFGPGEIYVLGYRTNAQASEMQATYESLRPKYLQANSKLASYRPKLGLSGDDERLIRLLGEAYTVEEAVERAKVDPTDAARLVAALQALDLVEEWSPGVEQFRSRLTSERQYFHEEIARIREEAAKREKQLFEGFERALAKIGSVMGGAAPSMSKSMADLPPDSSASASPSSAPPATAPPSEDAAKTTVLTVPPAAANKVSVEPKIEEAPTMTLSPAEQQPTLEPVASPKNGANKDLVLADPATLGEPKSPADGKFHEAIRQAADDRLDEAEVTLREAVRMDASRPDFLVSLARVLLANPRYERAGTLPVVRSLLDRAVQLSPDDPEAKSLHKEIVAEMG
jgi:DNA-binding MarR family transcriptional regulator